MLTRVVCAVCGVQVERWPSQVAGRKNYFCSRGCSRLWVLGNRRKPWVARLCEVCRREFSVPLSLVRGRRAFCSKECRRAAFWDTRKCEWCGILIEVRVTSKARFCSRGCHFKSRVKARTVSRGYMVVHQSNLTPEEGVLFRPMISHGRILEHRLVMGRWLGRSLGRNECVHHRNGDGTDNRIENLELIERNGHTKRHVEALKELLELRRENEELRRKLVW